MLNLIFWRKFILLFGAGMVGVVSLGPAIAPMLRQQLARIPNAPDVLLPVLAALSMIQPTLLLAGAVAVGVALAPRLGLRSHIAVKAAEGKPLLPALRPELSVAIPAGAGTGIAIMMLDLAFRPWIADSMQVLEQAMPRTLALTAAGLLYGGITEELLMRWGLMSLLAWLGWRFLPTRTRYTNGLPRPAIMWTAIIGAAFLFGVAHLPAAAALVPLTPALVARTILLNSLGGIVFGWLYWRRSLEAAMIAHASTHVVFSLVAWSGLLS
jgi:hypothetical protein